MTDGKRLLNQRIPLMYYALEHMQVSYNGDHEQHPLLYPLVLADRDELVAKGCTFKLRGPDSLES
jgi:hypothetical protein